MYLKASPEDQTFFNSVSAISGYSTTHIREIYEMGLIFLLQDILKNPNTVNNINLPFVGKVGIRYNGDVETPDGHIEADFDTFVSLDAKFKRLVGDMLDDKVNVIDNILRAKINESISSSLE